MQRRRSTWSITYLVGTLFFALASTPGQADVAVPTTNRIDELVMARLREQKLAPSAVCSDAVFVRRVYLDTIGTLPAAEEARDFILDFSRDKRRRLIDRLLEREEFADYWAMKWSDLLRVKAEFPINLWPNAAQAYHRWLRDAMRENRPYDKLVRDLLTASGSNFEVPPVNFYRAVQNKTPRGLAQAVALAFMGERAENWPSNDLANLAVFFANVGYKSTGEWKEEIVFFNPASTNADGLKGAARPAVFPDGTHMTLSPERDPRVVFAQWLTGPKNAWFARNIVNRAWSWLLGRGIMEPADDLRARNSPSNPELLAYLENELTTSGYDLKHVFRLILDSQTYQRSAQGAPSGPAAAESFASYPLRRLEAEVLIDAIDRITGATESYSSAIPEPYTFVPDNVRSIALPDGSISSPFLEMFGRPSRDTGLESERNNRMTAAQKLWLLNSSHMQRKIEQSRLIAYETQPERTPEQIVTSLYLVILSRFPTSGEKAIAQAGLQNPGAARRQAVVDLVWALMNTAEFLYHH